MVFRAAWFAGLCVVLIETGLGAHRLSQKDASQVLLRSRRDYQAFEEFKQGHLERECVEEVCNREEAREVFENEPETNYFFPKYLGCLAEQLISRKQIGDQLWKASLVKNKLRMCVTNLPNQCKPSPCHIPGTKQCNDLQGNFKCLCHNGWKGKTCAEDVNECEKQNGGCEHYCRNDVGGYMCVCEKGFALRTDGHSCEDIDECEMPDTCGSADCINSPGSHSCNCNKGFVYNEALKACYDVDECTKKPCEQACVNNVGSYMCRCDGRRGYLLHPNLHNCTKMEPSEIWHPRKDPSALCLIPQSTAKLTFYISFDLPSIMREILAFSIRTYDPEGLLLYTQRREPEKRSLAVALRDGHLEVQLQDGDDRVVTTGGPIINTGTWHSVVVERLRRQLIVRVAGEEVININRPDDAHKGTSRVEIALGGLTISTPSLIRPLPLRLDGCMRQLSLLEQDTSWLSQHISENPSQQCFSAIELGSYFSGSAYIHPRRQNYSDVGDIYEFNPAWNLQLAMDFRTMQPKPHSGLLFALVHGNEVPLSLSLQPTDRIAMQAVQVTTGNDVLLKITWLPDATWHSLNLSLSSGQLSLKLDSRSLQLPVPLLYSKLPSPAMQTFFGGLSDDVAMEATPVTFPFHGCLRNVVLNGEEIEFPASSSPKVTSHSCPTLGQA